MATSGTIGRTRFSTAKLLEKVTRRCGLSPQVLTPEHVNNALESLFMLLLSLSNRGLNLWCIDKKLMSLVAGQASYTLPTGTQDILNLLYARPSQVEYGTVVRFGVKFSTLPTTATYNLQTSSNNVDWVTVGTYATPLQANVYDWQDLDPAVTSDYFRVQSDGVVEDLFLSSANREIVITPFNRDDYSNQPSKTFQSNFVTNYYFEKLVNPKVTLWPVPTDDTCCLVLYRYRQIEDVGSLTEEIEIPSRWYEAITWHWAARLAFELPGVEQARRQEVMQMAQGMTLEVEADETDNAPVFFAPNIGVYTR